MKKLVSLLLAVVMVLSLCGCGGAKSKTKMARIPKQRNMQQIYKKRTWKKHSQARYLMCSVQFPAFVLQL